MKILSFVSKQSALLKVFFNAMARFFKTDRLANAFGWSAAGLIIAQGLSFLSNVLIIRILSLEGYGKYALILSTIATSGVLAGSWLGLGVSKMVSTYRVQSPAFAGGAISISLIFAFIFSCILALALGQYSYFIAEQVLGNTGLASYLIKASPLIILITLEALLIGVFVGLEKFKLAAKIVVFKTLLSVPLMVLLVYIFGLDGAIWATLFSSIINLILHVYYGKKVLREYDIKLIPTLPRKTLFEFCNFLLPAFLASLTGAPVVLMANSLLSNAPNGLEMVGIFSLVSSWRNLALFLPKRLSSVSFPIMSSQLASLKTYELFLSTVERAQWASIFTALPIVISCMFFSSWILLIYGDVGIQSEVAFVIMMAAAGYSALGGGIGPAIQAKGKMWFGLGTNVLHSGIFLTGSWLFVDDFGVAALCIAIAFANFVNVMVSNYYVRTSMPKNSAKTLFSISCILAVFTTLAIFLTPALKVASACIILIGITVFTTRKLSLNYTS